MAPKWPSNASMASFIAQRKLKAFADSNSSDNRSNSPSMKPQQVEQQLLLHGRQNNNHHYSVLKLFVLVTLTVLLFLNILGYIFDLPLFYATFLNFSYFSFSSITASDTSSSPSISADLNLYSNVDLNSTDSPPPPLPTILAEEGPGSSPSEPCSQPKPFSLPLDPSSVVNFSFLMTSSPILNENPPPLPQTLPNEILSSTPPSLPSSSENLPSLPKSSPQPSSNSVSSLTPPLQPSPVVNTPSPATPTPLLSPPAPPQLPPISTRPLLPANPNIKKIPKNCDLSKGEWVRDWQAPYYTNLTCYTIQEHQNCMKFGRPDLDFLKWRWKPDGCELPLFEPSQFLELMRGKTLAFVGDSLARNQMQSLMCLLSRVAYPEEKSQDPAENVVMYYPAFDFTITIFWSPFLINSKRSRAPDKSILWNFYLDEVDKKWASHVDEFDYIIISAGNWFNRPSIFYEKRKLVGCLYCPSKNVKHLPMQYSNKKAFHTAFRAITNSKKFKGTVILRTVSPAHFENGVWDKGGDCMRTKPFGRHEAKLSNDDKQLYKSQLDEFRRAKKAGEKKGMDFRILDTTNAMLLRPDGHPSKYGHWPSASVALYNDCVHWCLPGPVDMWNDVLLQMLSM